MRMELQKRAMPDTDAGLSAKEVLQSRGQYGSNELTHHKKKSFARKYLESFGDPIIKILLIALGINLLFLLRTHEWYESAGILAAILVATFISTLSEHGSESAFERLQEEASKIFCRVKRAEGIAEVPIGEIVVGDIVLLQAGDVVPADGLLINGALQLDQSTLNGESKECSKLPGAQDAYTGKPDFHQQNMLFRSTVVCSGEGFMRVCSVGDHTFYGQLAQEIQQETRESPMKIRLGSLAATISRIGYLAAGAVMIAYLFNVLILDFGFTLSGLTQAFSHPVWLFETLLNAATLAVAVIVMAVPEGLPMMITVVLSANMKRMLKDNVLVRKLVGIETAGSLNLLFTDKTGTLTRGELQVQCFVRGDGRDTFDLPGLRRQTHLYALVHASLYYNNGATMSGSGSARRPIGGNATDRALLAFAETHYHPASTLERLQSLPFDSARKYSATHVRGWLNTTLVKGAPEILLPYCTHYYDQNGKPQPLHDAAPLKFKLKELSGKAMRMLLLCTSAAPVAENTQLGGLCLVGLIGVRDEIRPEAVHGVRSMQQAGIQVVMITGDSYDTALAIARETGIVTSPRDTVLTSAELQDMSDAQIKAALSNLRVVARALPKDKSRLVKLAQQSGKVTGMTGDGVNDAPALKLSDVGFAMGSGTEVAKEAGDIVILDDNLQSISQAVLYGRTIFKSIRKFIIFQLTVNLCAVSLCVFGPFLGVDMPVTVLQMLWINMVMDTLAGLAFAGEPPLGEYMREPPKKRDEPLMNKYMMGEILFTGIYTALMCLLFLKLDFIKGWFRPADDLRYFLTAFFALFMFCAIFNSFNARTHRLNLLAHLNRNRAFIAIMGMVTVVQICMLYFGGTVFRTAGLTLTELLIVAGLSLSVIPVDFLRKLYLRSRKHYGGT